MKKLGLAVVALLAAACASAPAGEAERMPATSSYPVTQTAAPDPRVAELQTQLTELLERIDVLNQRVAQLEESSVEPAPAVVPAARPVTPRRQPQPQPAEETPAVSSGSAPQTALVGAQIADNYRQAITLFGRGKHADARRMFVSVYEADTSGDLADNALFWIGETWFAVNDYREAVRFYQRVVSDYPSENKAPDALFKIAMAQERTGDLALARRTLQQVIERFPYSSTASSAKAELERIRY